MQQYTGTVPQVPQAPNGGGYDEAATPLETLVAWVEDAEEASDAARKAAERDRDYFDGKQLTAAEKATLRKRGQPDVVINRIQPKVLFLKGWEATNRTDPRAFPRNPQDEGASEAATDALRFVADRTELGPKLSTTWEHMLIEGFGGVELVIEQGRDGPDIDIKQWDWDRLFYDPHSRKLDFSDARYLGGYVWMDEAEAKAQWPDAADIIDSTIADASFTQTYDDRPRWKTWVSGKTRKRVRIVQMYHKEGEQWMYCVFAKGGKLDSYPVPFVDQDGRSWCPLMLQSAFVDRDNNRYGLVRTMIDIQDEINKRRSKALHRLAMRQVITERGAVEDEDATKTELARPTGMITVNPGFRFELLDNTSLVAGEISMMNHAEQQIELLGPNAAMQGKDEGAPSGRAIRLNQQSGQTELNALIDQHKQLRRRVYRGIWDLIRQYKREPWWIRVTDNEQNVRFVGINRPVTLKEDLAKNFATKGMQPQQIEEAMQQLAADPMRGPTLDQVVRVENQPTEMWMDITIEDVPDTANVQEEQFNALVQLAPAVTFPPRVYLMASNLRNKKELLEELEGGTESPEEKQAKQAAFQLEMDKAKSEIDKRLAEIEKLRAETRKIDVEADMAQMPQGVIVSPQVVGSQPGAPSPAGLSVAPPAAPPTPQPEPMQQPMPRPAPQSLSLPEGQEPAAPPPFGGVNGQQPL